MTPYKNKDVDTVFTNSVAGCGTVSALRSSGYLENDSLSRVSASQCVKLA